MLHPDKCMRLISTEVISFDCPELVEKNMTLAYETWFGEDFVGGCRIENAGVVTDKGWEKLYTTPYDEILVPTRSLLY